jgi:hypothetical protein
MYRIDPIKSHHAGFGMYQQDTTKVSADEMYCSEQDAIQYGTDCYEVYKLGADELPDGVEDIRGRIYGESGGEAPTVYYGIGSDGAGEFGGYFAIAPVEVD